MAIVALRVPARSFIDRAPFWPLLALSGATLALAIGWIGFAASDDAAYYFAASRWLEHAPQPGDDHWGTRFPLILSLALSLALLGKGAAAMTLTALGWYAALLASVRAVSRRIATPRAAWVATMLVATMPVVVTNATTVSCDLTEAVFLLLGGRLLGDVAAGKGRRWTPLAAGVAFGTAILCRETAVLALFGLVPLFAIGRPITRRALIVVALGCAGALAGEAMYQWLLTGDPLHRWTLAFHHDGHIDRAANDEGNWLVHPAIDPLLVLLVNDDFALLFWALISAITFRFDRKLDGQGRQRLFVLTALACSTFLLVAVLTTKLVLNPRYFALPAITAAIAVAAWLDRVAPRARALALGALVGSNLLMLAVENQHPRWPAQALVAAAAAHAGATVSTDAATAHRALIPLRWGALRLVTTDAPREGTLWFGAAASMPANATVLARYPSPPTVAGAVLERAGLANALPASVRRRLLAPNPEQVLARQGRNGHRSTAS